MLSNISNWAFTVRHRVEGANCTATHVHACIVVADKDGHVLRIHKPLSDNEQLMKHQQDVL